MPLSETLEAQVHDLAARYGTPLRVTATIPTDRFNPLNKRDRVGEVCMVVRRKANAHLLTAIKTHYPTGAYRLLTGGIAQGESIEDALLRETYEETGLDVVVRRFLAVIEYQVESHLPSSPPATDQSDHLAGTRQPTPIQFTTFAFLLDEVGGVLMPQDESEQIADFREVAPDELPAVADFLEALDTTFDTTTMSESWRGWGTFRAVVHRVVYATLTEGEL
jgi:8-oxo-dGTP pyrophosphatase MutT (NUDIX family)